ncbi:MAG: glycosyltransferase, partial [Actinomycetota bacterium]|nr:glycosyltransferase [Actinomycetota bacterium]
RYLQTALERAGVFVDHVEDGLDYGIVDPTTNAVVIVESVYPAFDVMGKKPAVPTLFWVHHGEHHLDANLRLANRYGADAILLAHSWHLAHRFSVPVHRYPFGIAPEIGGPGERFEERRYDVAMVAAGLRHDGGTYTSRQEMAEALTGAFDDRSLFTYGLLPDDFGALYRDARVVTNDGGRNHRPITMRVFEAIGNGARLLTEDAPGLDRLLEPGRHYVPMSEDPVADVREILTDPSSAETSREAREFALGHHTYDHRVDQLFEIVDVSTSTVQPVPALLSQGLAGMIDAEAEIQVVVDFGHNDLEPLLATREVRDGNRYRGRLKSQSVDAIVLGPDVPDDIDEAVSAARSYVFALGDAVEATVATVAALHPEATVDRRGHLVRVDLGRGGYRRRPPDHPLA